MDSEKNLILLGDAADIIGIDRSALMMRIHRRKARAVKRDGRLWMTRVEVARLAEMQSHYRMARRLMVSA